MLRVRIADSNKVTELMTIKTMRTVNECHYCLPSAKKKTQRNIYAQKERTFLF